VPVHLKETFDPMGHTTKGISLAWVARVAVTHSSFGTT